MMFGSVCSGIEAASVAWNGLDWKAAWFAEIEPFPSAVLAHHYPEVPNLGDMTKLPARIRSGEVEAPDVFCGGTPCQAFSVAGLRRSLDDARGNLSLVFCEIADAIDTVRLSAGDEPSIIFWENVPGVLSTSDNAFGCFLAGLAGEDDPLEPPGGKWTNAGYVLGPQRAVAWRVTDAQYFGVAQRRRRVFVVASAREGFDPAAVLFEFDGLRRDTPPSREAGEGAAGGATNGAGVCGVRQYGLEGRSEACGTLRSTDGGVDVDHARAGHVITMAHGQGGAEIGFDRGPTLTCNHEAPIAAYPSLYSIMPMNSGKDYKAREVEVAQPLMAAGPGMGNQGGDYILQPAVCVTGQVTHTLKAEGFDASEDGTGRGQPIVVHGTQDPCVSTTTAFALGRNNGGENAVAIQNPAVDAGNVAEISAVAFQEVTGALSADDGEQGFATLQSAASGMHVMQAMQVRRLTPRECERLQGFPDDYTLIPWRKKPASECPDGPRYKALGNSWAVPNVRWIGERIQKEIGK